MDPPVVFVRLHVFFDDRTDKVQGLSRFGTIHGHLPLLFSYQKGVGLISGSGQKVVVALQGYNACDAPGMAITTILLDSGQEISTGDERFMERAGQRGENCRLMAAAFQGWMKRCAILRKGVTFRDRRAI
jgi:hypothetical protein